MTGIFVASTLVIALALLALVMHRHGRRAHATGPEAPGGSLVTTPGDPPTYAVGPGPDDLVLVPFPNDTGQALVVGPEDALAVFDQSGLSKRSPSSGSGPVAQLVRDSMAAGALDATDRFRQGANSGRIVALTPETMKRLEKGSPVYDKAGNLLATIRGEKGQFSTPMHLDKAGAQVAAASNMATLAVTAALSQQLEAISEQLQEMSETLEGMVKDKDRERLSDALAANEILFEIAESVHRRGITQADYVQLASLKHRVTSLQIETTAKLAEIAPNGAAKMGRSKRLEVLEGLYAKERLEYWLALQVQADLARTRCDLLTLLWEHRSHPETAAALNQDVATAVRSRQLRAAEVGDALRVLSDPTSQTRLDPVRVISRHRLGRAQARIDELLLTYGDAFAGPEGDPHTVWQAALEPAGTGRPRPLFPPAEATQRPSNSVPRDLTYDVWTDGACAGNPGGPGGYAAVLVGRRADGSIFKQWEVSDGEAETTNNRMELMAVVAGLRELTAPARVCIHIDSSYVMNTFTQGRRERWQGNDWRTSARKPVKNRDLWKQLFTEVDRHQVEWEKVPGHTGVELNERADELACAQRDAHDRR